MWDVKGNCAKGRSKESLQINRDLDNIKAQIIKHYQHLSDREAFVTTQFIYTLYRPASSFCLNASRRSVGVCLRSRRMTTQKFV